MKRFGIILLGVFVWGALLIPSGAVAHTSHAGIHAQSPFDAPKAKKSLHCILKGHKHSVLPFCPHTMQSRDTQTQFKSDCGDHPSGAQVQTSWSKILILIPSTGKFSSTAKKYFLTQKKFHLHPSFADRLEKPPQHA